MSLVVLMLLLGCGEPPPTWHDDIQPIVATNCGACHVQGGAAPFALETYDETLAVGELAYASMAAGTMPPWPADPDCREFYGQLVLEPEEIEAFRAWLDADAPLGASSGEPVAPPVIGTIEPTHTDTVPGYVSTAVTEDEYRCFVLDTEFPETMYLEATHVVAGAPQVHHVLVYAIGEDAIGPVLAADAAEEGPGYSCFGNPLPNANFVSLDTVERGFPNQIGAWVPGQAPAVQAPGDAIRVEAGSTVVLQVHYSALAGDPAPDETEYQMILSTVEPTRLVRTVPLLIPELSIHAGSEVSVRHLFGNHGRNDVTITSMTPHMHLLASKQQVDVVRADETRECGLDVPEWDFDWQMSYLLDPEAPIVLAPGDGLELTCVFDNTAENQPFVDGEQVEPRYVEWGDGSLDEMCMVYLSTVEPFTPLPDASEKPCAGTEQCVADCGDSPTADCLLQCPEADAACAVCMLDEGYSCGFTPCALGFSLDESCITTCLISTLMFGGSTGQCLADQCAEQYDPFVQCAEDKISSGECNSAMNRCGWEL